MKFKSERHMQELFVNAIEKKSKGYIYQEVGNMASFFRADVVEYNDKDIRCYELKLRDFKKLFEQCQQHIRHKRFDLVCAVIPKSEIKNLIWDSIGKYGNLINNVRVFTFDGEKIEMVKRGKINKIDIHNRFYISDLIVRGYHMEGKNCRKHYK